MPPKLDLSDEDREQRKKEQSKLRSQKYYEKNKDKIAERRKVIRNKNKEETTPPSPPTPPPPTPTPTPPTPTPTPKPQYEVIKIVRIKGKKVKIVKKIKPIYDLKKTQETFKELFGDDQYKQYSPSINRIFELTNCNDLADCLKNYTLMRKEFEKGMSTLGNSTKRKLLSCILMIIQKFPTLQEDIPREIEDQYIDWQKVLSLKVTDEQNNREAKVIPTWKEYLTAVKKKYGENSKEFLVSLLYKRVPVRDDLYLKVIEKDGEQTDKDQNYIIIPKKGKCIVIINTYKTEKRYGANHKYDLDKITEMLLRKYIEKHNIIKNGFLWNEKKLSKFASTINKNIGIEGIEEGLGIKIYREMNVTEGIPENATPEQLVALARKMLHSVSSQDAYKRKHKT